MSAPDTSPAAVAERVAEWRAALSDWPGIDPASGVGEIIVAACDFLDALAADRDEARRSAASWMNDARLYAANADYWRKRAEDAEALLRAGRRARRAYERWQAEGGEG